MASANVVFEVKAESFRLMTGMMAPGKDVAAGANEDGDSRKEREKEWCEWLKQNNGIMNVFLMAATNVGFE